MTNETTPAAPDHELPPHEEPGQGEESLEAVTRARDEFKELLLRKTAEFDNYRKRVEKERRELAEYAAADLIKDILPLLDDFERAVQAPTDLAGIDAYREGVGLIHRRLLDLLAKRKIQPIDPLGADFDPREHEALARETAGDRRDGEIIEVFSRGYRMGDRLLRPALVKVATA
jgi:molecular chaperone GrpE